MSVREVACAGAPRTLLCAECGDRSAPAISLAAGVHGDEQAGPLALISLAEDALFDPAFSYRIWPCTNPFGFDRGTRQNEEGFDINRTFGRGGSTPESAAIVTANRDRRFVLSIDLHEDLEEEGFYLYEYGVPGVGRAVLNAVGAAGYPLLREPLLRPDVALESEALGGYSFTMISARRAAQRALTFEAPGRLDRSARVEIHRIAVKAAVAALSNLDEPYG